MKNNIHSLNGWFIYGRLRVLYTSSHLLLNIYTIKGEKVKKYTLYENYALYYS